MFWEQGRKLMDGSSFDPDENSKKDGFSAKKKIWTSTTWEFCLQLENGKWYVQSQKDP